MAYIKLNNELPGIRGLMVYSAQTAKTLNALAEVLLRDNDNTLTRGERELIATYVSYLNDCFFCQNVHGALAGYYLGCNPDEMDALKENFHESSISGKMKTLLSIAASVQQNGQLVTPGQIEAARLEGATDLEIHDTVLIASAFCMFNRYVDGLGTLAPEDRMFYVNRAPQRAAEGYLNADLNK